MAGHNKWSKIKRQKGAADAKRGAVFTKIGNIIAIAARKGTDPSMNPDLASAIEKAKAANMPKANIEKAIARVADKSAAQLEEIIYEGYGPQGVAFVIEAATDNRNRTLPEVKTALTKNGGTLADPGSVLFQFDKKAVVIIAGNDEQKMLTLLDCGAEDVKEADDELVAYAKANQLNQLQQKVAEAGLEIKQAEVEFVAHNQINVDDEEVVNKVLKIMNALDDLDDVLNVYTNADF